MTYQVLARKWRPRTFDAIVGQDHVVRALTHALTTQRLHHAWLFTGTRGVGKTTLSRLLAKSLNCHSGITASPCNQCPACLEIDAGNFVDYIELDAASNRGVDEMTQLLEQAVYAPSSGRFKVYMIDEVHMLTGHAFNAMLKTLEEPPEHVKFILATTDPQKIPVTVLSRCLQFNLKQMTPEAIVSYLDEVLASENIKYDPPALRMLARAAAGSMRDALSLADQGIGYGAGALTVQAMQDMLGTLDDHFLISLVKALGAGDAGAVVAVADDMASRGISYTTALADLANLLSTIAIEQQVPGALPEEDPRQQEITQLAQELEANLLQLFYSVAVHSRQELSLAPDAYAGFVMACLRMLALAPQGSQKPASADAAPASDAAKPVIKPPATKPEPELAPEYTLETMTAERWPQFVRSLPLSGAMGELARQSEWLGRQENTIRLRMGVATLGETTASQRLSEVLSKAFKQQVRLSFEYADTGAATVHALDEAHQARLQQQAEQAVAQDAFVNTLIQEFDGQVVEGSIQPVTDQESLTNQPD